MTMGSEPKAADWSHWRCGPSCNRLQQLSIIHIAELKAARLKPSAGSEVAQLQQSCHCSLRPSRWSGLRCNWSCLLVCVRLLIPLVNDTQGFSATSSYNDT
jgi:hypothetical protein